ncbi:hypothetical protein LSH36_51g00065 [Paralvinella palmiformis]|uniref:C-type lectin domain-containing protein n=1 Tax=Paralvinella palmiformis TaxID=53620 RepID=A0AAD9K7C1_9ANNE|nr:hypothetical protein LSH36_51g00065 [Paralvinella palmiformis]
MMLLCILLSVLYIIICDADQSHQVINSECTSDSSICYILYQADREVITWKQAYDYCQQTHHRLALIPDNNRQKTIKLLNSMTKPLGDGHAWVAGHRSVDNSWYDVTGTIYTDSSSSRNSSGGGGDGTGSSSSSDGEGRVYETFKSSQTKCVQLFHHNATRRWSRLEALPCYAISQSTLSRALCQYVMTPGTPLCEGYNESGICYLSSAIFMRTWYDARKYCATSYPGGRLAYLHLSSQSLRDYFWSESRMVAGFSQNLWVGIERNSWQWIKDDIEIPVVYSAWYPEEGAGLNEDCLLVDLNAHCSWADKACNYTSSYFICQDDNVPEAPDELTTALVGEMTSALFTTETESYVTTETIVNRPDKDWSTVIIVSTVLGLLFLAMFVGLIICVTRDRRKLSKSLLRRLLAYSRYGRNGSRRVTPEEQGRDSSDWSRIVMADGLERQTSEDDRLSDASSVSVGLDLISVSGLPPEGEGLDRASGSGDETATRTAQCKPSPVIQAMAAQGAKSSQDETYMMMSNLTSRKPAINRHDTRGSSAHRKYPPDAGSTSYVMTTKLCGRQPLNPADLITDERSSGVLGDVEDPMYVVRITLPQQDVATHTNQYNNMTSRSPRTPTSGGEPHYKSPRIRPRAIYATVNKRSGQDQARTNDPDAVPVRPGDVNSVDSPNTGGSGDDLDIIKEVENALRKIDQIE